MFELFLLLSLVASQECGDMCAANTVCTDGVCVLACQEDACCTVSSSGCSKMADCVGAFDPFCLTAWDAQCMDEAKLQCGLICGDDDEDPVYVGIRTTVTGVDALSMEEFGSYVTQCWHTLEPTWMLASPIEVFDRWWDSARKLVAYLPPADVNSDDLYDGIRTDIHTCVVAAINAHMGSSGRRSADVVNTTVSNWRGRSVDTAVVSKKSLEITKPKPREKGVLPPWGIKTLEFTFDSLTTLIPGGSFIHILVSSLFSNKLGASESKMDYYTKKALYTLSKQIEGVQKTLSHIEDTLYQLGAKVEEILQAVGAFATTQATEQLQLTANVITEPWTAFVNSLDYTAEMTVSEYRKQIHDVLTIQLKNVKMQLATLWANYRDAVSALQKVMTTNDEVNHGSSLLQWCMNRQQLYMNGVHVAGIVALLSNVVYLTEEPMGNPQPSVSTTVSNLLNETIDDWNADGTQVAQAFCFNLQKVMLTETKTAQVSFEMGSTGYLGARRGIGADGWTFDENVPYTSMEKLQTTYNSWSPIQLLQLSNEPYSWTLTPTDVNAPSAERTYVMKLDCSYAGDQPCVQGRLQYNPQFGPESGFILYPHVDATDDGTPSSISKDLEVMFSRSSTGKVNVFVGPTKTPKHGLRAPSTPFKPISADSSEGITLSGGIVPRFCDSSGPGCGPTRTVLAVPEQIYYPSKLYFEQEIKLGSGGGGLGTYYIRTPGFGGPTTMHSPDGVKILDSAYSVTYLYCEYAPNEVWVGTVFKIDKGSAKTQMGRVSTTTIPESTGNSAWYVNGDLYLDGYPSAQGGLTSEVQAGATSAISCDSWASSIAYNFRTCDKPVRHYTSVSDEPFKPAYNCYAGYCHGCENTCDCSWIGSDCLGINCECGSGFNDCGNHMHCIEGTCVPKFLE